MSYLTAVGLAVRRLRKRAGLTQRQVTSALGLSSSAWSKVEHGLVNPGVLQLARFAQLAGVSLVQLAEEIDNLNVKT
tara:strand:+ start:113 stop:343 length:231 start_codon:yes stop_codon:yes gene_type:complete